MSSLLSIDGAASRPLVWVAALAGALVLATLTLWFYYGTAVFFEVIRAGWAACF